MDSKELRKVLNKSADTLKALIKQMEMTHPPLKDLLKAEIDAYCASMDAFRRCIDTLQSFSTDLHNDIPDEQLMSKKLEEDAKAAIFSGSLSEQTIAFENLKQFCQMMEQLNSVQENVIIICDEYCELFLNAIDRDYKKWENLAGELAKVSAKFTVGLVLMISEASHILNTAKEVADIVREYGNSVPNYAETDKQLQIIDKHTKILKVTTDFFEWIEKQIPLRSDS